MRPWRPLRKKQRPSHPTVHFLFDEIQRQKFTMKETAERAGMDKKTLINWRLRTMPKVADLDAALQVLGFRLCVRVIGPGQAVLPRPVATVAGRAPL